MDRITIMTFICSTLCSIRLIGNAGSGFNVDRNCLLCCLPPNLLQLFALGTLSRKTFQPAKLTHIYSKVKDNGESRWNIDFNLSCRK